MTFGEFLENVDVSAGNQGWSQKIKTKISCNQREVLNCVHDSKYTAIYKGRQDGITTALSLYTLWTMIKNPKSNVMCVGNRGVGERFGEMVNHNSGIFYTTVRNNRNLIELSNGSRLLYQSYGVTDIGKGLSTDVIIAEEFGEMVRERDRNKLLMHLMMCVSTRNGKFVVTTSDMSLKNTLDTIGFNEVYGNFFSGTRTILTEKIRHKKS
jgi:hypothetical protein